jgi:dTMP kinase
LPKLLPGLFIAFEGGDGAGKSTQAAELAKALESGGFTVLRTREPGGTAIGEKLRSLVLDHGHGHIDAHTEALIFAASRAAHANQVIRPALERGEIVLTDRYIDSSVAYQGAGRGLGEGPVRDLSLTVTGGLLPDRTFVFLIDPDEARRRSGSDHDRIERVGGGFMHRVDAAYRALADAEPERIVALDGARPRDEIAEEVREHVRALL